MSFAGAGAGGVAEVSLLFQFCTVEYESRLHMTLLSFFCSSCSKEDEKKDSFNLQKTLDSRRGEREKKERVVSGH